MAFAWCQTGSEADEEDGNQRSVPQAFAEQHLALLFIFVRIC